MKLMKSAGLLETSERNMVASPQANPGDQLRDWRQHFDGRTVSFQFIRDAAAASSCESPSSFAQRHSVCRQMPRDRLRTAAFINRTDRKTFSSHYYVIVVWFAQKLVFYALSPRVRSVRQRSRQSHCSSPVCRLI